MARGKRRRPLEDGQSRRIKTKTAWPREIEVEAYREDCDSPHILLVRPGADHWLLRLTDGDARQLIEDLKEALYILPTSK